MTASSGSRRKFSREFKDELCREVIETSKPVVEVARSYSVGAETLRRWLIEYRDAHGGSESELSVPERARLKALEVEVRDLRAEAAFLKKAAAYFAKEPR
jgi:transposase